MIKPLIIANAVVYILQEMSGHRLTNLISLDFGSLMQGQVWRLFTYMFAHGGFFHILFNMWGLWIFGGLIEQRIGGRKLLHLYLISGFIGGVTWLLFNHTAMTTAYIEVAGRLRQVNIPPQYPSSVGASGSVFGFLIAAALLDPNRMMILLFPPIPIKLKTFALIYGLMEAWSTIAHGNSSNIAHLAHLGGMLGGYLYIRWVFRGRWKSVSYSGPGSWFMPSGSRKKPSGWNLFNKRPRPNPPPPPSGDSFAPGDPMKEIDGILDKIGREGIGSLTDHERKVLQDVRQKLKQRKR